MKYKTRLYKIQDKTDSLYNTQNKSLYCEVGSWPCKQINLLLTFLRVKRNFILYLTPKYLILDIYTHIYAFKILRYSVDNFPQVGKTGSQPISV